MYRALVRLSALGSLVGALLACEKSSSDHDTQADITPPVAQRDSDPRYDPFSARLADFDRLSVDDPRILNVVEQGWRELQSIAASDRPDSRQLLLQMYLRLLAAIERRGMDPAFRHVERPSTRTDPDIYREVRLPFGISRNPILDLVRPTDYELAIRNNHRFELRVDLRRTRESVIVDIEQLLKDGISAPGAWRDFKEAIAVADIGDTTREQLRNMLHSGAGKNAIAAQSAMDPKYELLIDHLDIVTLHLSVIPPGFPSKDPGGLFSALLYTSAHLRMEPHMQRLDGSFISGDARLSKEDMLLALGVLERGGLLASAETYYQRSMNPQGPPPAAKQITTYFAARPKPPVPELHLIFFDENYSTSYIILPSWEKQLVPLLTELRRAISDSSAKALVTQLLSTATVKVRAGK